MNKIGRAALAIISILTIFIIAFLHSDTMREIINGAIQQFGG